MLTHMSSYEQLLAAFTQSVRDLKDLVLIRSPGTRALFFFDPSAAIDCASSGIHVNYLQIQLENIILCSES